MESLVNSLLARFLDPYVEGLSTSKLHFRFSGGKLELKDMPLKSSVLGMLGLEMLELERGKLDRVLLEVPFSAIKSKKIHVYVCGLQLATRNRAATSGGDDLAGKRDAELLAELRESRRQRVEMRATQLHEARQSQLLLKAAKRTGEEVENKVDFASKLVRQILVNLTVEVADVGFDLLDEQAGARFAASLASAFVGAPRISGADVAKSASAPTDQNAVLHKSIGLHALQFSGGRADSSIPIVRPLDAVLELSHDPGCGEVSLRFEIRQQSQAGAELSLEQAQSLAAILAGAGREASRLEALRVPRGTAELVDLTTPEAVERTGEEFVALLRRERWEELPSNDLKGLDEAERWRLQLLWDVVDEHTLARWTTSLVAEFEQAAQRRQDEEVEARKTQSRGWLSRWGKRADTEAVEAETNAEVAEDTLRSLREETEALDSLEIPARFSVCLQLARFGVSLQGINNDSVLEAALLGFALNVQVQSRPDYRGVTNASVALSLDLQGIHVQHQNVPIFEFGRDAAWRLEVEHQLRETGNIIVFSLQSQPVELFFVESLLPSLREFYAVAAKELDAGSAAPNVITATGAAIDANGAASEILDNYFARSREWIKSADGKNLLSQAKRRVPDALELHVNLCGPQISVPVSRTGGVFVSLGSLRIESLNACTMAATNIRMALAEMEFTVTDNVGIKRKVVETFSLETTIQTALQMNSIVTKVDVRIADGFHFTASPEAVQIIFAVPHVLATSFQDPDGLKSDVQEYVQSPSRQEIGLNGFLLAGLNSEGEVVVAAREYLNSLEAPTDQALHVTMELGHSSVLLVDAAAPVLRLGTQVQNFAVNFTEGVLSTPTEGESHAGDSTQVCKQAFRLSVDVFNVRVGRFEPLLEPFEFNCKLARQAPLQDVVRLHGQRPLLLNITPSSVRLLSWYVPNLFSAVSHHGEMTPTKATARYRLLNLSASAVRMQFLGCGSTDGPIQTFEPTGGEWVPLDCYVLPGCRDRFQLSDGGELGLHRLGCATLGKGAELVQVLRPRADVAMLLISASRCLVANETSLPLFVRFPGVAQPIPRSFCADAAVLHGKGVRGNNCDEAAACDQPGVLLPGEVASAPSGALATDGSGRVAVRWEAMPPTGDWGGAFPEEDGGAVPVICGTTRMLAAIEVTTSAPPARVSLCRLRLMPALRIVSGLPCAAEAEYKTDTCSGDDATGRVFLRAFGDVAAYDVATPGRVSFRVRVEDGHWSPWVFTDIASSKCDADVEVEVAAPACAGASLILTPRGVCEISLHCPLWLVDRTGWQVSVVHKGMPLSVVGGIGLCASSADGYALRCARTGSSSSSGARAVHVGPSFSLPTSSSERRHVSLVDGRAICVRGATTSLPHGETRACPVTVFELVPHIFLHNASANAVEFAIGNADVVLVAPGASLAPSVAFGELRFRPEAACATDGGGWSTPIPIREGSVGAGSVTLPASGGIRTVEVRPDRGVLCVVVRDGSDYSIENKLGEPCDLRVRGLAPIRVLPGQVLDFGWADPFGQDAGLTVEVVLGRKSRDTFDASVAKVRPLGSSAVVAGVLHGSKSCLVVRPSEAVPAESVFGFEVLVPKLGISTISEEKGGSSASELLFLNLEAVRVSVVSSPNEDSRCFDFLIGNIQLDWQAGSFEREGAVLGNRGLSAHNLQQPFFHLAAEQIRVSSSDLVLSAARLLIDETEVGIDDRLAAQLQALSLALNLTASSPTAAEDNNDAVAALRQRAGKSLLDAEDWELPVLPTVLHVGEMHFSIVSVAIWCALQLRTLTFLPRWVRVLLKTLTFSNTFALEGSVVRLSPRAITDVRGSVNDVAYSILREYMGDVIRSMGSVLGHSSLLNIPRAPLQLGWVLGGAAAGAISDASQAVVALTFDHSVPEEQRRARSSREIRGMQQGMVEAMSDLGDGIHGVLDVVRKPLRGARDGGASGFIRGLGAGLIGGVTRPLSAVGHAVSDIGSGVVGQLAGKDRKATVRSRLPRLLAGPMGAVVEYSALDAQASQQLSGHCWGIEVVVPLLRLLPSYSSHSEGESRHATGDDVEQGGVGFDEGHAPQEEAPVAGVGYGVLALVIVAGDIHIVDLALPTSLRSGAGALCADAGDAEVAMLSCLTASTRETISEFCQLDSPRVGVWWSSGGLPLKCATWGQRDGQRFLTLQGKLGPLIHLPVSFQDLPCGAHLEEALSATLSGASPAAQGRDWTATLRMKLSIARQSAASTLQTCRTFTCTVWEVQRLLLGTSQGDWRPPYLPGEREQRHRWLDRDLLHRHPNLDPSVDANSAAQPPLCVLPIWEPVGEWRIEQDESTDPEGWQYAVDWRSSVWRQAPRALVDIVRRRQWVREYRLSADEAQQLVDMAWIHASAADGNSLRAWCGRCCRRIMQRSRACCRRKSRRSRSADERQLAPASIAAVPLLAREADS